MRQVFFPGLGESASGSTQRAWRRERPARSLCDGCDALVVQTQKTMQSREIGHTRQSQCLTQLAVFAQPQFGFAKGPVLVTHQAENGQQWRLRKLVLAETTSITRKDRPADLQSDASKRQESDFGHRASCLHSKQQLNTAGYLEFFIVVARLSTEPDGL